MNFIYAGPDGFTADALIEDPILRFFHYAHLPPDLQGVSKPFCDLAAHIVSTVRQNDERKNALRKLLEAKDSAVRAMVALL